MNTEFRESDLPKAPVSLPRPVALYPGGRTIRHLRCLGDTYDKEHKVSKGDGGMAGRWGFRGRHEGQAHFPKVDVVRTEFANAVILLNA